MKYRESSNGIQHFVEEPDFYGHYKIIKIFYSKQSAIDYINSSKDRS